MLSASKERGVAEWDLSSGAFLQILPPGDDEGQKEQGQEPTQVSAYHYMCVLIPHYICVLIH